MLTSTIQNPNSWIQTGGSTSGLSRFNAPAPRQPGQSGYGMTSGNRAQPQQGFNGNMLSPQGLPSIMQNIPQLPGMSPIPGMPGAQQQRPSAQQAADYMAMRRVGQPGYRQSGSTAGQSNAYMSARNPTNSGRNEGFAPQGTMPPGVAGTMGSGSYSAGGYAPPQFNQYPVPQQPQMPQFPTVPTPQFPQLSMPGATNYGNAMGMQIPSPAGYGQMPDFSQFGGGGFGGGGQGPGGFGQIDTGMSPAAPVYNEQQMQGANQQMQQMLGSLGQNIQMPGHTPGQSGYFGQYMQGLAPRLNQQFGEMAMPMNAQQYMASGQGNAQAGAQGANFMANMYGSGLQNQMGQQNALMSLIQSLLG